MPPQSKRKLDSAPEGEAKRRKLETSADDLSSSSDLPPPSSGLSRTPEPPDLDIPTSPPQPSFSSEMMAEVVQAEGDKDKAEIHSRLKNIGDETDGPIDLMMKVAECYYKNELELEDDPDEIDGEGENRILETEKRVIRRLNSHYEIEDVSVGSDVAIHTISFTESNDGGHTADTKVPIVMLHGMGIGNLSFHKNYEDLAEDRRVYGIDLPGFALSTRVKFSSNRDTCELQVIELIDKWREVNELDKMILLGHSVGGYIAAAYALKFHQHVRHLVLVDPWGMLSKEEDTKSTGFLQSIACRFSDTWKINPLDIIQHTGYSIVTLFEKVFFNLSGEYGKDCIEYARRCITVGKQTGGKLLAVLSNYRFLYPKDPMKPRLLQLPHSVDLPITFIYGENSKYHNGAGIEVRNERGSDQVTVECIEGANHHLHAMKAQEFNKIMKGVFKKVDARNPL